VTQKHVLPGEILLGPAPRRLSKYQRVLDLEIGQTILYRWREIPQQHNPHHFSSAMAVYSKRYGMKFSVSKQDEGIYVTRKA